MIETTNARTIFVLGNAAARSQTPMETNAYEAQIKRALQCEKLESWSRDATPLLSRGGMLLHEPVKGVLNPLFDAALTAFSDHYPLALSPDMIWLAIAQGFSHHVNLHAEELRSRFVAFEGKKEIVVRRDDFVKGNCSNDWESVFSDFSAGIADVVGPEKRDLIVQAFSTTGAVERAALEVTLMDAMQSYFEYKMHTLCGIPEFLLEGEVSDWHRLRDAAELLGTFGMEWWMPTLLPTLDEFAAASAGRANPEFWQDFFNLKGNSGGPYYSGHILDLFPYILDHNRNLQRNKAMSMSRKERLANAFRGGGIGVECIPGGLSVAPFVWNCLGKEFNMEFVAGFVGIEQRSDTLALRPKIGWAIREFSEQES